MKRLIKCLQSNEKWLMRRILHYAIKFDFSKYTSTLEEAWRMSITGLTDSFVKQIQTSSSIPELHPDEVYEKDPLAKFGIIEAQLHRKRGVTLAMFLSLMKY